MAAHIHVAVQDRRRPSDDDLELAGLEHAALDDPDLGPQRQHVRADAAHFDAGFESIAFLYRPDAGGDVGGGGGAAIGRPFHARRVGDDAGIGAADGAAALELRTLAEHDDAVLAALVEHIHDAGGERQDRK